MKKQSLSTSIVKKCEKNPLIKPADVNPSHKEFKVLGSFNPGATIFNNEIILLLRVAEGCNSKKGYFRVPIFYDENNGQHSDCLEIKGNDPDLEVLDTRGIKYKGRDYLTSISHIRVARSKDGVNFTVDDDPFIRPISKEERYGIEDARITRIDDRYYINFTVVSEDSWSTMLAVTDDFVNIERLGIIFHPENKDVAIFPEKVNGKYIALHRPNNSGFGRPCIWYAESPDLLHWGKHKCMVSAREDNKWEGKKIGGGAPPIKTKEGWLTIYHAKDQEGRYSLFPLLLDLNDPLKIIKRADEPIIVPDVRFETEGFWGQVVFTNGMVEKDGELYIYYGAADESVGLATVKTEDLLKSF